MRLWRWEGFPEPSIINYYHRFLIQYNTHPRPPSISGLDEVLVKGGGRIILTSSQVCTVTGRYRSMLCLALQQVQQVPSRVITTKLLMRSKKRPPPTAASYQYTV